DRHPRRARHVGGDHHRRRAQLPGPRCAAPGPVVGADGERGPDVLRRRAMARRATRCGHRGRGRRLQPDRLRPDRPPRVTARMRPAALILVAAVACAVPLDPPPAGPATGDGPPRPGGVLRLSSAADVRTLDPAAGYDETSWLFEQTLFETLVGYDEGTRVVPQLAASWEMSPDGRRYTFRLRDGIRFSTGRRCTASDVKYSLERVLTPAVHSLGAEFFAGIDGVDDFTSGRASEVRGIVAVSGDQLAITLADPDPLFLDKLTMPFAAAVDR